MDWFTKSALAAMFIVVSHTGCARHRPPAPVYHSAEPVSIQNQLASVSLAERTPISLSNLTREIGGTPLISGEPTTVRDLTPSQCESLAAASSRIANALQAEQNMIRCNVNAPECVVQILRMQAIHQRNESAGQALEAYLNLVEIYLQHDLLNESTEQIDIAVEIVEKLRAADVDTGIDNRVFDRQQNELEEKAVELAFNQRRLTTGLELLLQLDRSNSNPIWTNYQADDSLVADQTVEQALATAWANRRDLQALRLLADCCDEKVLDLIRSSAKTLHPLLGLNFKVTRLLPRPRLISREAQAECCSRRSQIQQVIDSRKQLIELEISELVQSIQKHKELIKLKQSTIKSLQDSIESAEKAAEVRPVDLEVQLKNKSQVLEQRSALIHERIALEIDRVKLKRAQGLLGR